VKVLHAVDGRNILIRESIRDFAKAMVAVLEAARSAPARRGRRETAEQQYSWEFTAAADDRYLDVIHVNNRGTTFGAGSAR